MLPTILEKQKQKECDRTETLIILKKDIQLTKTTQLLKFCHTIFKVRMFKTQTKIGRYYNNLNVLLGNNFYRRKVK